MKYKLLIFDLDGTILDTLEDLANSVNYALATNNLPQRTIEEVRSFVGNGIQKLIERAVPTGTDEKITATVFDEFKKHYKVHCADYTKPYDGINGLIRNLRQAGFLTAVVSNKADFAVQDLCNQYFPDMFDFVIGEKEGVRRKPYPDSVFAVLEHLQIDKKDAIYIGDSEVDVETARNAEMDEIAVTWGFREVAFLKKMGATVIANKPEEILSFVK